MKGKRNQWLYFTRKDIPDKIFLENCSNNLETFAMETGGKIKLEDTVNGKKVQEYYRKF